MNMNVCVGGGVTAIRCSTLISALFVLAVSKGQLTQKCVFVFKVLKQYSKLAEKRETSSSQSDPELRPVEHSCTK